MHAAFETTERYLDVEGRKIMVDVTGTGPPIVFVHGVWATGGIWYPVVERLASRFTCVNIHLPLGVHRYASPKTVDHSPAALARTIASVIRELDLHDVTLVGNDTGGALCQILITTQPERIGRLVLTNCDAFEVFPPKKLAPVYFLARFPALWAFFAGLLRDRKVQRRFFATVSNSELDPENANMLMTRFANDAAIREDLRLTIRAISPQVTLAAAKGFRAFEKDVLVLWGTEDRFFPVALGERLAAAFPRARLTLVPDAMLFVGLDRPDDVARAIAEFAGGGVSL